MVECGDVTLMLDGACAGWLIHRRAEGWVRGEGGGRRGGGETEQPHQYQLHLTFYGSNMYSITV